ncbi:MAG TPA: metalloregulator ArsR/SmtB family transcription factor [Ramlibacter sp.]|nr:metalloregulator ArsR/SmtB family transcription factor [Ramlibacter sp.]
MNAMPAIDLPLDQMQAAARDACALLKVLSNPDRLLILCYLSRGEARVGELEEALAIQQPTLSQQLTVLRDEQLVTTRREGKNIYYSLASGEALAVIETLYLQFCGKGRAGKKAASRSKPKE